MTSGRFTATLLRASVGGFASLAVSRTTERVGGDGGLRGGFDAWQAHFRTLLLELAAAVDDGGTEQFAIKVGWTRDAFAARGFEIDMLRIGVEELAGVLQESLPAAAWEPLAKFFGAADRELQRTSEVGTSSESDDQALDEIAHDYVDFLREGHSIRAIARVVDAIRDGKLSIPDALDGVLTRALREIGRLWHADALNVAQEHFATQTTGRLLEQMMLLAERSPSEDRSVVLTMVEGDAHDLGLRIVAAFFELDGWRTICLGANTPATDLALAIPIFDADLVVLGATLNTQRDAVTRTIEALKDARPELVVLVGGAAFAGLAERSSEIGADGCALNPRDAVRLGRELVEAKA